MIKLIKKHNTIGIGILNIFIISIGTRKGVLVDTLSLIIKLFKFELGIFLGKENKNGKITQQELKKSKNYDAFA